MSNKLDCAGESLRGQETTLWSTRSDHYLLRSRQEGIKTQEVIV